MKRWKMIFKREKKPLLKKEMIFKLKQEKQIERKITKSQAWKRRMRQVRKSFKMCFK